LTTTNETNLFFNVSYNQSYGIGVTFINPVPFLDSSLLHVQ